MGWGLPDPDWPDGPLDARKAKRFNILEDVGAKTLRYLYDFGDGCKHTIKIERLVDPEPGALYPRLVGGKRALPSRGFRRPWGYAEMPEAIKNLEHERHDEIREWLVEDFDPNVIDIEALSSDVAALAKKWSQAIDETSAPDLTAALTGRLREKRHDAHPSSLAPRQERRRRSSPFARLAFAFLWRCQDIDRPISDAAGHG